MQNQEQGNDGHRPSIDARSELLRLMAAAPSRLKGPRGERVFFLTITAELAKAIFEQRNAENPRRLNPKRREGYLRDYLGGNWLANYDALVFSEELHLWNGQHRMSAQAASGETILYIVVVGAPAMSKAGMDIGCTRSISVTHGMGTRDAAIVSCMMVMYGNNRTPTKAEKAAFFDDHRPVIEQANKILQRRKLTERAPVIAAFALAMDRSGAPDDVCELAEDIASMTQRHLASRTMVTMLENNKAMDVTMRVDQAVTILRCIESHLQQDPVRQAKFTTSTLRKWVPESTYRSVVAKPES